MPPHPTTCRSILILSFHLRLVLPSGFFPSSLPTRPLYTPLLSPDTHLQWLNEEGNIPVNGTWLLKHKSRTAYCPCRKESRCFTYRVLSCSVKELFIAVTSLRHFLQFQHHEAESILWNWPTYMSSTHSPSPTENKKLINISIIIFLFKTILTPLWPIPRVEVTTWASHGLISGTLYARAGVLNLLCAMDPFGSLAKPTDPFSKTKKK